MNALDRKQKAFLLIVLILILDQVLKYLLIDLLFPPDGARQITITSFFNLTPVWNHGVSFGLFQASHDLHRWLLVGVASAITVFLGRWLFDTHSPRVSAALAMTIGGAVGNIIDRIWYGAVFDFLDFHLYGYHWPAFNIADSAICIGLVILLADATLNGKAEDKK